MICIAYLSTAVAPPDAAELDDILAASQRNNARQGVTGLLCHYEGAFLQFLEGEAGAVEAVYARIAQDPRHFALVQLYRRAITQRLFADWTMAVARPDRLDPQHSRFLQGLRELQVGGSEEHARAVKPFLDAFRAWLR